MFKRLTHIVLSGVLSLLLLFGGTAKEFVHFFAGHTDTVHATNSEGHLSFDPEHHHCSFLSFSLPAFNNDSAIPFVAAVAKQPVIHRYLPYSSFIINSVKDYYRLRGPPIAFI